MKIEYVFLPYVYKFTYVVFFDPFHETIDFKKHNIKYAYDYYFKGNNNCKIVLKFD